MGNWTRDLVCRYDQNTHVHLTVRTAAWASAEKNAGGGKNILEMAILVKTIIR